MLSFVVPNGLDWEKYRVLPPRGDPHALLGMGDAPLVLFLGRLRFRKGLDLLIPAFNELRKETPDAQLAVVGPENDSYGQKVRGWVRDRSLQQVAHFVGPVEHGDAVQAYVDADVFASPSYPENFGMTVAEAMACGLPLVISDQGNINAEVAKAGAGLVTRADVGQVTNALLEPLQDGVRRHSMGEVGRRLVQERYTWLVIVDVLTGEYGAVIGGLHTARGTKRAFP